jgi:VanZ family protein
MRSPLVAWLLVACWAAAIFALSSLPGSGEPLGTLELALRKIGHVGGYTVLAVLISRALAASGSAHVAALAAALSLAYAASDELHQSFVDGRTGTPRDVAIDAIGVAAGCLLAPRLMWRRTRPA